jgi:hypothetical protein
VENSISFKNNVSDIFVRLLNFHGTSILPLRDKGWEMNTIRKASQKNDKLCVKG